MQRICFVVATDATAKTSLLGQLRALSSKYQVSVVANTKDLGFLARAGIDGEVIPVPIERKVSVCRDLWALLKLYLVFRARRFHAIHSITPKAGLLSMVAGTLARTPVRTHTFTGQVWASKVGLRRLLLKGLDWVTAHLATDVLADSPSQRSFLEKEGIAPSGRIEVLGQGSICGVDLARFRPDSVARQEVRCELGVPASALLFLFLGRVNRDKGLLDLIPAFVAHAAARDGSYLVIVGPDEEHLRPLMEASIESCKARVRFLDFTPRPERFMAGADVLCLPSYREGFGSVIIEAAACGVPAIASRIYGLVDAVVDGQTGLLHEPRDTREIARLLGLLADNEELRLALGDAARQRAHLTFGEEKMTRAVVDFYEGIAGRVQSEEEE